MRKFKKYLIICCFLVLIGCKKETKDALLPYPEDITFNEIELDRFSFLLPEKPMIAGSENSGKVIFEGKRLANGNFEGFALSNKNYRSYPWSLSFTFGDPQLEGQERIGAIDSTVFSVYTNRPNRTENYLVGNAVDDKAVLKLEKSSIIEHVLIANTTFTYLQTNFGSVYSGTLNESTQAYEKTGNKVRNPLNPNTSTAMYGVFYLPTAEGKELISLAGFAELQKREAGEAARQEALSKGETDKEAEMARDEAYEAHKAGELKLIISGYKGGQKTGDLTHYLAVRKGVDPLSPEHQFVQNDWLPVDLSSLGVVDELRFKMDGDYRDDKGKLLSPTYFCIDGIRLRK